MANIITSKTRSTKSYKRHMRKLYGNPYNLQENLDLYTELPNSELKEIEYLEKVKDSEEMFESWKEFCRKDDNIEEI